MFGLNLKSFSGRFGIVYGCHIIVYRQCVNVFRVCGMVFECYDIEHYSIVFGKNGIDLSCFVIVFRPFWFLFWVLCLVFFSFGCYSVIFDVLARLRSGEGELPEEPVFEFC